MGPHVVVCRPHAHPAPPTALHRTEHGAVDVDGEQPAGYTGTGAGDQVQGGETAGRPVPGRGRVDPAAIATRHDFAASLTTVREAAGLTVREVARAAGIRASTAGGYFSGRHLPPRRPDGGVRAILAACSITDPDELDAWEHAVTRVRRSAVPASGTVDPPYRGLLPYREQDATRLHGRDDELHQLAARVATDGGPGDIVVLLGPAGSGKTSLLAAGLVPRIGIEPGSPRSIAWMCPGPDPLHALAAALTAVGGRSGGGVPVLIVDQLEELFTCCTDASARTAFLQTLDALSRPGPGGLPAQAVVVAALRSEYLPQAAEHPDLIAAVRGSAGAGRSAVPLLPLRGDQVAAVVRNPVEQAGIDLDDTLLDAVLTDVDATPEPVLPRLSHALLLTWRRGQGTRLALDDYRAIGGVRGAMAGTAEAAYAALGDGARAAARRLLTSAAGRPTALPLADVFDQGDPADTAAALATFTEVGLLVVDSGGVRLASDALIDSWSRLAAWSSSVESDVTEPTGTLMAPDLHPRVRVVRRFLRR
jgi:transcriptional regulator with XRE-family HTH domain